jgi:hypothetical protein
VLYFLRCWVVLTLTNSTPTSLSLCHNEFASHVAYNCPCLPVGRGRGALFESCIAHELIFKKEQQNYVGNTGLEPVTFSMSRKRSNQLS